MKRSLLLENGMEARRRQKMAPPSHKRSNEDLFVGMEPFGKRTRSLHELLDDLSLRSKQSDDLSLRSKRSADSKQSEDLNLGKKRKAAKKQTTKKYSKSKQNEKRTKSSQAEEEEESKEEKQIDPETTLEDFFPFAQNLHEKLKIVQDDIDLMTRHVHKHLWRQRQEKIIYSMSNIGYLGFYEKQLSQILTGFAKMKEHIMILEEVTNAERDAALQLLDYISQPTIHGTES